MSCAGYYAREAGENGSPIFSALGAALDLTAAAFAFAIDTTATDATHPII